MLRTFNLGCGLIVVSAPDEAAGIATHFAQRGHDCWQVGQVTEGVGEVLFDGDLAL
jgi:phosphoribosylaminoimidazole (AIR) synthetase